MDETTTRLKSGLDINDLRDPNGEGVEFEVDENDLAQEGEYNKCLFYYIVYLTKQLQKRIIHQLKIS